MIQKYTYNKLTWIDLESPTKEEVSTIINEHKLHSLIGDELLQPSVKPRVDYYKNCIFLILHFPSRTKIGNRYTIVNKEIDFIIGKDFLITTKYDTVDALHNFSKIFEVNSILDKTDIGEHAGFIFYYMMKKLYSHVSRELDSVRDELLHAESRTFEGDEKKMVEALSYISREIIDYRQTIRPHKDIFQSFGVASKQLFGEEFDFYNLDIQAECFKAMEVIQNHKELLADLRDTNDSLLSTKQNETMRILTIMAFVTFPLSLITDIFSMRTTHAPIIGMPFDFELILAIMIAATLAMFGFFKFKKWL